jgi:hypothetical protein
MQAFCISGIDINRAGIEASVFTRKRGPSFDATGFSSLKNTALFFAQTGSFQGLDRGLT